MGDVRCVIHRDPGKTGSTVLLHLAGSFDRKSGMDLRRELRQAFDRARGARVVIDMAGVDRIGSECIEVLLVGYTRAMRSGHGYEVVGAEGHVRQALEATGLCPRSDDNLYAASTEDAIEAALAPALLRTQAAPGFSPERAGPGFAPGGAGRAPRDRLLRPGRRGARQATGELTRDRGR
ncbi:STAS domain-containing protein [Actinoplanes siamensis]|uniref:STAS domain-containing protein n=1 Tax=Actinoplanes siamensis TaxID=1223317 RepID=A0A919NBN8_9ACTN|nr:STAS domain-containing protein [Actinoplanes siamensis]GIF08126.1 hypothetical protein Asi03nite_56640 [Actinoplanes siamensis]